MKAVISALWVCGVAAGIGAAPSSAAAAIYTVTFAGKAYAGGDLTGMFGPLNGLLTGADVKIEYLINTGVPGVNALFDDGSGRQGYWGVGTASPLSAVVTINNISHVIEGGGGIFGYRQANGTLTGFGFEAYGPYTEIDNDFEHTGSGSDVTMNGNLVAGSGITDINPARASQTWNNLSDYDAWGTFVFYDYTFDRTTGDITQRIATWADFEMTSATLAVPEPATWPLLIAGFGSVGGMVRRRRAAVAI